MVFSAKMRKRIGCLTVTVLGCLFLLHACGFLPTSRMGPRNFLLPRDYRDMKKIFGRSELPKSFKLEAIKHRGGLGGPDGPYPVVYKARVNGSDYNALVGALQDKKHPIDYKGHRFAALDEFNKELVNDILMANTFDPPKPLPDHFEFTTTSPQGYPRDSKILADTRTSGIILLYITTHVPFEG